MAAREGGKPVEYRSGGSGGAICAAAWGVRRSTARAGRVCEYPVQVRRQGTWPRDIDVEPRG
jgi:hypothetical protein